MATLMGLCAECALASFISYEWSYSGRGGVLVDGRLRALGTDPDGNLDAVSDVWFKILAPFAEPTSMLEADTIRGWNFSSPRIPANGSTEQLDFCFGSNYLGLSVEFLLFKYPGDCAPFGAEVSFTDSNENWRMFEEDGVRTVAWSLWKSDENGSVKVPDTGGTLGLSLLCGLSSWLLKMFLGKRSHR